MNDSQTIVNLLKTHVIWAGEQEEDFCDQCIRPWNDGICSCGHYNHKRIKLAYKISTMLPNGPEEADKVLRTI